MSSSPISKMSLSSRCSTLYYVTGILNILPPIAVTGKYSNCFVSVCSLMMSPAIFTLRTYAIYGRSWTVLFLLAVPALVTIASEIVHLLP